MRNILILLAIFLFPATVMAQDPAVDPAAAADAAVAGDAAGAAAEAAPAPAAPAAPTDPGDIIADYFTKMGDIVAENMENPNAMVEKFSAYIKENEKSMRAASKKFESKVSSMKSHEAEAYRESVQRKITPALNKLISLLVDFENRYPDEAMRLDSILKVDAKYTYQQ